MKHSHPCYRLLSCLLIVCLLCGLTPGIALTARADTGDWEYRILENGAAEITGYTNRSASALTLPLSLGGAWVRSIAPEALTGLTQLRSLRVPATVTDIAPGAFPAGVTLQAYHGAQAHAYANSVGLSSADLSAYDFTPTILDLSDMTASMWQMTGSEVRIGQPFASLLSAGAMLYLPPKGGYQQGRPVQVEAMSMAGDTAVLTVRDLDFREAVASYSVRNAPLVPDYSSFVPAQGVSVGQGGLSLTSKGNSQSLPIEAELSLGDTSVSLTADLRAKGTINHVDYHGMALHAYNADIAISAEDIELAVSTSADKDEDVKVPRAITRKLGKLIFTAYGVFHLELELHVFLSVEGSLTFFTQEVSANAHMEWTKSGGGKSSFDTDASAMSLKEAEINFRFGFEGEASVHLGFTQVDLSMKIASLEMFVGFDVTANKPADVPCVDLSADILAEGSFAVGWLGVDRDDDGDSSDLSATLSASWPIPPARLPMMRRHWEECEVWQDYCTYHDTSTFYFMTMCDIVITPITVKKGEAPTAPVMPTRDGYTFDGWYTDEACTSRWYPAAIQEPAMVIYAKWRKDDPTPTPVMNGQPTPAPGYEAEVGGGYMAVPYPVFPADMTLYMLDYAYDAEYGGYAITGHDSGRLNDYPIINGQTCYDWYAANNWTIVIPASINGVPVVSVRGSLPQDKGGYRTILCLPDSIRYIGNDAQDIAYTVRNVKLMNIPAKLEYIGNNTIHSVSFVNPHVVFPETLKYIGYGNFNRCSIKSVKFQGSNVVIGTETVPNGERTFGDCYDLEKIDFGNAVTYIGAGAFYMSADNTKEIYIPGSVSYIGNNAFFGIGAERIVIGKRSSRLVLSGAFNDSNLGGSTFEFEKGTEIIDIYSVDEENIGFDAKEVIIPEGVTQIKRLHNIRTLSVNVIFPKSLVTIGEKTGNWKTNGFAQSTAYMELTFPESLEVIEDGSFYNCAWLVTKGLNEGLRYIGSHAFEGCPDLVTSKLPDTLEEIGTEAFKGSNKAFSNHVTFPAGVCKIGDRAFDDTWLGIIYVPGDIIAGEYIFGDPSNRHPHQAHIRKGSRIDAYLQEYYPDVMLVYIDGEDEARQYTVKFDTRGMARVDSVKVAAGELIPVPADPVGDSRQFTGWYLDSHGLRPWNFNQDVMPEENLTLYAGWKYVFNSTYLTQRDEITLTHLIAPEAETEIPAVYEEKTVTGLGAYCVPSGVVTLKLPETLKQIDPQSFDSASDLQAIIVDAGNPHFYAEDGVLYAADGTLMCYPQAKAGAAFTAAAGTAAIAQHAFCRVQQLKGLTLPASLTKIAGGAFHDCDALTAVRLSADVSAIAADALERCDPWFYGPADAPRLSAWADQNGMMYNCYNVVCMSSGEVALVFPVRAGSKLPELPDSEIGQQHITGWATDARRTRLWDFGKDVMPASTLTLYAVWGYDFLWQENDDRMSVTLTGYTGDDTTIVIPHDIRGKQVTGISADCFGSKTGLTLVDDAGSAAETLAAQKGYDFQRREYTVTFNSDGGAMVQPMTARAGDPVPVPETPPRKSNYAFSDWFESSLGSITADTVMPGRDVYLKALYTYTGGDESCDGLLWEERDGGIVITGYTSSYYLTVPSMINGLPVTAIADRAFAGCNASSITLPDSIREIGEGAFSSCTELTALTLPAGVSVLKQNTFNGCLHLTDITLPEGLQTIEANAFRSCPSLTSVTLPASVRAVSPQAFSSCKQLQALAVDAASTAYTAVDGVLFSKDQKTLILYPEGKTAESYTVPEGVTAIGEYALQNAPFKALTLAASVTAIKPHAVQNAMHLDTLTLPGSGKLATIGEYAFSGCHSLTALTLPRSLQEIGAHAFANTAVAEVHAGSAVRLHDQAFSETDALVIYGATDTKAHQWAQTNSVRFVDLSKIVPVETVTVQAEAVLNPGDTLALKPITAPSYATEAFTVTYESSRPYVAAVDENGVITARLDGVAVITVRAAAGVTAECVVTVRRDVIPMEGITLSATELILRENERVPITWAIYPGNANSGVGASPVWESSDPLIARWDSKRQQIVAVGLGTADITITLNNGMRESITVSVQRRLELPDSVTAVEAEAFMGTSFTHIHLPDGLLRIGERAFADCDKLDTVYIPASVTDIAANAFTGSPGVTICCKPGSAAERFAVENGLGCDSY